MRLDRRLGFLALAAIAVLHASAASGETIQSSERCGQCHQTIFDTWAESAHARALEPPFITVFHEMQDNGQGETARVCLKCHAPAIDVNGDEALELRVTWEGINCDVCHSLVSVDLSGMGPRQVIEPGRVKRGPVEGASDDAHGVAYSELHTRSLACAWCHEYVNPEGTAILTTYSEWMGSSARERDETCQDCHMGRADAEAADPRTEREPGAEINLHHVPGGHSLEQLHKALSFSISPWREGDELVVEIRMRNKGAGHAVPTGMPGRRVVLDVDVKTSDGALFEDHRTYGKFFVDAKGEPVTRDSGYFVPGVRLETDSRIQPDERRTEIFRFPVAPSSAAYVNVRFHYEHSPFGTNEGRTWLTFLSEKRTVKAEAR